MRRILSIFVVCLLLFPTLSLAAPALPNSNPITDLSNFDIDEDGVPDDKDPDLTADNSTEEETGDESDSTNADTEEPLYWNQNPDGSYSIVDESGNVVIEDIPEEEAKNEYTSIYAKKATDMAENLSPSPSEESPVDDANRSREYPELPASGILLDNDNLQDDFETAANNFAPIIFSLLLKLGFVIAVVVLAYQGVLWIMASSPQKKAELKEGLIGTFVALFILATGAGYAKDIITFVIDTLSSSNTIDDTLTDISSSVYHVIRLAGIAIAILAIVISGIGCLTGTADKKATFKLQLLYISGGLFLLLSATSIIELFVNSFR